MRLNNQNNLIRSRLPLALGVLAAAVVLAPVAEAAQRFGASGGSFGKVSASGPIGGLRGITGHPGGGGSGKPGKGGGDGGRISGGGGGITGGHDGRPRPPHRKPPILITVPTAVTGVTATVATAATTGNAAPQRGRGGGSAPSGVARGGYGGLPPADEQRYVPDEVLIQLAANLPELAVDAFARRTGLTRIESATFGDVTMSRWRIPAGRSVPDVIRALQGLVLAASPNYYYTLRGDVAAKTDAAPGAADEKGSHWQYALAKLNLPEAHALAKGDQVLIAVI